MALRKGRASGQGTSGSDLQIKELVDWDDVRLDAAFRAADTLPLEGLQNGGTHTVDVASQSLYNDANWKGFLPKGLPVRNTLERLSTGYAKRFWKKGGKFLGETIYVNGRILVNHLLEEVTIDRPTNDLDPGRYILLRYTDPVFEHLFYDVMKAVSPDLIVYRGYSGRFPDGRRGFTAPLARRFTFAQMGTADHELLFSGGRTPTEEDLSGSWRLDAIATSNQATTIGSLRISRDRSGTLQAAFTVSPNPDHILPDFVSEHFTGDRYSTLKKESRVVDATYIVGRWTTDIRGPFAKLLFSGSLGLFHGDEAKSPRRFTMNYVLVRA
jgi:hypothetical protein